MSKMDTRAEGSVEPARAEANRWKALAFIALAQLMVTLDVTIVNIALPSAQQDLGISDANRQWVITAYALTFGGLLLFGGRVADLWGRRRTFLLALVGFAAASALGGAAVNEAMLVCSRALRAAFGALLAPTALSLLTVTFTDGKERAKAFGIFGAIAGGGGAVGRLSACSWAEFSPSIWTGGGTSSSISPSRYWQRPVPLSSSASPGSPAITPGWMCRAPCCPYWAWRRSCTASPGRSPTAEPRREPYCC